MLVLTRKLNQSIKIGDDIEITVVEVRGDQVRLGVAAPKDVAVHRKGIWMQVQEENEAASRTAADVPVSLPAAAAGSTVGLTLEEIRRRQK